MVLHSNVPHLFFPLSQIIPFCAILSSISKYRDQHELQCVVKELIEAYSLGFHTRRFIVWQTANHKLSRFWWKYKMSKNVYFSFLLFWFSFQFEFNYFTHGPWRASITNYFAAKVFNIRFFPLFHIYTFTKCIENETNTNDIPSLCIHTYQICAHKWEIIN